MMDKYVALQKLQVFDRGDGPRWLAAGDPVPVHYMSKGMIKSFVAMGYMELVTEVAVEGSLLAIADALDEMEEEIVEDEPCEPLTWPNGPAEE